MDQREHYRHANEVARVAQSDFYTDLETAKYH